MQRRQWMVLAIGVMCLLVVCSALAQQPAGAGAGGGGGRGGGAGAGGQGGGRGAGAGGGAAAGRGGGTARIPLFFKEEWKQDAGNTEHPAAQESVANANLEIKFYGQNHDVLIAGNVATENNPPHMWTGTCTTACAVALRDKTNFVDITGLARMKWLSKMSGYHEIRPIVKLASGTWLIGEHADGNNVDWLTNEFSFSGMRWLTLDIARVVTTGTWVANPDLSKVDEIGFADLTPGSGHGAGGWSDVATIEVYGKPVPR
ncbi:MAG TPA: hypothetical protein VK210_15705 [Terriglobia bacterium]|nr:hypothetical protein [Terriglobia bacterium]